MDYFDSIFFCIAIFCSVLVFCVLCCNSSKDSSETLDEPMHHTDIAITSSSHTPLRRANSGDFHQLRTGDLERPERPIGFTTEVCSGTPQREPTRPPNPPYPVENLMPAPESRSRTSTDHPSPRDPRDDVNPPSYEQVMSNESYYLHPQRN